MALGGGRGEGGGGEVDRPGNEWTLEEAVVLHCCLG